MAEIISMIKKSLGFGVDPIPVKKKKGANLGLSVTNILGVSGTSLSGQAERVVLKRKKANEEALKY